MGRAVVGHDLTEDAAHASGSITGSSLTVGVGGRVYDAPIDPPPLYGLDIETDTLIDGLDPAVAAVTSVAVAGEGVEIVADGDESTVLRTLDAALADLAPGVLVTWNGAGFDLPFLADRARSRGTPLGLRLRLDPRMRSSQGPLRGHPGFYRATWYGHRHLDGYRVFRADVGASVGLSCGLKPLARLAALPVVEVDRTRIHELSAAEQRRYVLSDAVLARALVARRWETARRAIDDATWVAAGCDAR